MELIPQSVVQLLWQRFALKLDKTTEKEQHAAIILLSMLAGAETDIVKSNLDILVEHGLGQAATKNYKLPRDTCAAILKITVKKKVSIRWNSY